MGNRWGKATLPEVLSMFCYGIHLSTSKDCTPSELKWRSVQCWFFFHSQLFGDFKIFHVNWWNVVTLCVNQDSAGRSSVREQHFTLQDDMIPGFGLLQSFLLLTDHYILGRAAFIFMILLNVGLLLTFRFVHVPPGRGELCVMSA